MICVRELYKSYGKKVAVSGLSFAVEPGQVLGLVGPNGAGKTTTLQVLSGILPGTHEEMTIGGFDVIRQPIQAKKLLAFVPDEPMLFDLLTVWEHFRYIAAAYDVKDYKPKAEALLEQFELADLRNTLTSELSRGMKQRLSLCLAYLHDPKAILLDEPLTGIDPRGIRTAKDTLKQHAANGAAIILSSHLLDIVEDVCTHLLILQEGQSVFFGSLDEAREKYKTFDGEASLEDAFLRATSENGIPQQGK
ncbi:MAG: ABC transporter ATP-binding protein [Candidatus Hydrogenedentes bacterium]|nr:ABC transporter ATP-binding protein [Candidatus Hydrogenedentota bacterium]